VEESVIRGEELILEEVAILGACILEVVMVMRVAIVVMGIVI